MDKITTVQVKMSTKAKLDQLKITKEESMDSVIARLTNMAIDYEPLSKEEIERIERSLLDIKAGRVHKMEDVAKELGLK